MPADRLSAAPDPLLFRVGPARAILVFWTAVGGLALVAGVGSYGVRAAGWRSVEGQPTLVVLGLLLVGYVQVVYPRITWLRVGRDGFVLRTLPGRRVVAWSRVGRMESASALMPAGRGGNLGGVRVYDAAGALILIVPDVFVAGRDALLAVMERARREATAAFHIER